ncbi:MAG: hypothetical protein K6F17_05550 [Lachnospiraceae bacterium]|nr:hypothetical protein [Lachnospiraceae bacterium]
MEDLIEYIVKRKAGGKSLVVKGIATGVCVTAFIATLLLFKTWLMIATVVLIIVTKFVYDYYDCEYEYSLMGHGRNAKLNIDRILGRKYRKNMISVVLSDIRNFDIMEAHVFDGYRERGVRIFDFSANDSMVGQTYALLIKYNNDDALLYITPNDRLINAFKNN